MSTHAAGDILTASRRPVWTPDRLVRIAVSWPYVRRTPRRPRRRRRIEHVFVAHVANLSPFVRTVPGPYRPEPEPVAGHRRRSPIWTPEARAQRPWSRAGSAACAGSG